MNISNDTSNKDMRDAFFDEIYLSSMDNKNIVVITNDMDIFSLRELKTQRPNQFINVGVAEQNMINIASGLASLAKESASASMSRPSASVFITSIVLPFLIFNTSPGLDASPPSMLSVMGKYPLTLILGAKEESADIAPITAAAPPMSVFISDMPCHGLIESPPESKVIPLPTRAKVAFALPFGL